MAEHLIYLAAGSSRRFGGNKLLFELGGRPMFLYGLETLAAVAAERESCDLTVVSRSIEVLDTAERLGARAVFGEMSENGLSHSIRSALAALEPLENGDTLLFAVADQPRMSGATVRRLLDAIGSGALCATAAHGERPGNPTAFSGILAPELRALEGDSGGRAVLRAHGAECVRVPVEDEAELIDVDRQGDVIAEPFFFKIKTVPPL